MMHGVVVFLLVCCFIASHLTCVALDGVQHDSPVVETSSGAVRGRLKPAVYGLSVRQFLGIPFAEPPIGQLRFARPQAVKRWSGVREAVAYGPECPQEAATEFFKIFNATLPSVPQSEDCLTLNVFTPKHAKAHDKRAVMVWIHGGGFIFGSSRQYDPTVLAAMYDVIVVTINYRLGVLGFFNIPGTDVKGNYGMYDQVHSLKWVQENIANFGGDPGNVTIYGESAGGMSVSLLLLSPLGKGLFHRAIAQSGSSATPFTALKVESSSLVEKFAKELDCAFDEGLMDCLRSKSALQVFEAQRNFTFPKYNGYQLLSTVIIDGEFLPDEPRIMLREGRVNKVDVITGVTRDEGALMAFMAPDGLKNGLSRDDMEMMVGHSFMLTKNRSKLAEAAALYEYQDHNHPDDKITNRRLFIDISSDTMFNAPVVYEANALVKLGIPVYFYVFNFHPDFAKLPKWYGAFHGVDLFYVFGEPLKCDEVSESIFQFLAPKFSDRESGLSLYMMRMWTNFAKHGDPNYGDYAPVTWPRYTNPEHAHLTISLEPKVEYQYRADKMAFWNEFIPKLTEATSAETKGHDDEGEQEKRKEEL